MKTTYICSNFFSIEYCLLSIMLTDRTCFALLENSTKFTILQLNLQILNIHLINLINKLMHMTKTYDIQFLTKLEIYKLPSYIVVIYNLIICMLRESFHNIVLFRKREDNFCSLIEFRVNINRYFQRFLQFIY